MDESTSVGTVSAQLGAAPADVQVDGSCSAAHRCDDVAVLTGSPVLDQHRLDSPRHARGGKAPPSSAPGRARRLHHAAVAPAGEQAATGVPGALSTPERGVEREPARSSSAVPIKPRRAVQAQHPQPLRHATAHRSQPRIPVHKEPLKQQTWSFGDVPDAGASGMQSSWPVLKEAARGRPAFYPRAGASRRPAAQPLTEPQPKASSPRKSSQARQGGGARPGQLAQPRHAAPAAQPLQPAQLAAPGGRLLTRPHEQLKQEESVTHQVAAALHLTGGEQSEPYADRPCTAADDAPAASRRSGSGICAATIQQCWARTSRHSPSTDAWPQGLGLPLSGSELQRATAAYSQERFDRHLQCLAAALADRRQRRCQAAGKFVPGGALLKAHSELRGPLSCWACASFCGDGNDGALASTAW